MDDQLIFDALQAMYGSECSDAELLALQHEAKNSGLDPLLGELIPLHDPETGLFYLYATSKSVIAQLQKHCADRGATCWFDHRIIVDDAERAELRLDDADAACEVRLSDTLAQVEYRQTFKELRDAGYPYDDLVAAIGHCPRPTVTVAVGRYLSSEAYDPKFRMSPMDYAIKRGMRRAAEMRMPTTAAARVSAQLVSKADVDALPAPSIDWSGIADVVPESATQMTPQERHAKNQHALGRNDDEGLF